MKKDFLVVLLTLFSLTALAEDPEVYFIHLEDGQEVVSPIKIKFGLVGFGVAPAGVKKENTGHHHLLIDVVHLPNFNQPISADKNHIHFGGGQTETLIDLPVGSHTLQLLLGNEYHIPHTPALFSKKITIEVVNK